MPTPEPIIIWQDFVENCMRMKEIGQRGACAPTPPPSDPPILLFVKYPCNTYNSYFIIFYSNLISVAGPGFVTRNGGCQRQSLLLFGKIFVKNCMRMKEIGQRGAGVPNPPNPLPASPPPPRDLLVGSANIFICEIPV